MHYKREYGTRIAVWGSPFDVPAGKYTDEHDGLHPAGHRSIMESGLIDLCLTYYPPEGIEIYYRQWTDIFGIPICSLPFAADTAAFRPCAPVEKYRSALCFIGGIHRTKQRPFDTYIRPLLDRHRLISVGNGWEGWPVTRMSIPYGEESTLISSAALTPNVHMDLSREIPFMPPNMRTFQSVAGGGFVLSDNVPALRNYFHEDEVPIGETPEDYAQKIDYLMNHPEARYQYWSKAYRRVMAEHTCIHRAETLLEALPASVGEEV